MNEAVRLYAWQPSDTGQLQGTARAGECATAARFRIRLFRHAVEPPFIGAPQSAKPEARKLRLLGLQATGRTALGLAVLTTAVFWQADWKIVTGA